MENIYYSGQWYLKIVKEEGEKVYCYFDLIKEMNYGCSVDRQGSIEKLIRVIEGYREIDNLPQYECLRELNADNFKMYEEFLTILNKELETEQNKINDIKKLADKYQENYNNSKDYTIVYKNDGIKVNDFNFSATKFQEAELINNYKNSELRKYISFEVFVYNYVKEKYNNEPENNIIEIIKKFKWKLTQIWVENNCIFAEVKKTNGKTEQEGLYAGSDDDLKDVYKVFSKLRYTLNFNGMLNDDNVMI